MTDNELNALIAEKVKGQKTRVIGGSVFIVCATNAASGSPYIMADGTEVHSCPNYAGDIDHARELLDKIGPEWHITSYGGIISVYKNWRDVEDGCPLASDGQAPRAICLAALKSVGVDISNVG